MVGDGCFVVSAVCLWNHTNRSVLLIKTKAHLNEILSENFVTDAVLACLKDI